jgi:drug/metabolite transporter (DMT)-like permease
MPDVHPLRRALPLFLLAGLCLSSLDATAKYLVRAGLGHWFVIGAHLLAPASLLTPLTYLQMVWATSYGFAIFGQLPDRWSALGMAIIVVSGLWLAL